MAAVLWWFWPLLAVPQTLPSKRALISKTPLCLVGPDLQKSILAVGECRCLAWGQEPWGSLAGPGGPTGAAASHHFCPGQLLCKDHLFWNGTRVVQQVLPFLTTDLPLVCPQPEPGWSCQVPSFRARKILEAPENGDRKNWHVEMLGASRSRAVPAETGPSGQWGWSGGTGCRRTRLAEPSPVASPRSKRRQRWSILGDSERNKGPWDR